MIDVVICTHNPRRDYLEKTIRALHQQSLPKRSWKLTIVDSCSHPPVIETLSRINLIDMEMAYQLIREDQPGLTRARLRGITETSGDILIFVDDDNVLSTDYLAQATHIAEIYPFVGCFGGAIHADFESPPAAALVPYLPVLALRDVIRDSWSNAYDLSTVPYGAGLVIRRQIACFYTDLVRSEPNRERLGRNKRNFASGEDLDMAFCACDLGMATGLFKGLRITHLIPNERLNVSYLRRLAFGAGASDIILQSIRFPEKVGPSMIFMKTAEYLFHLLVSLDHERARKNAFRRGQIVGLFNLWRDRR